MPLRFEQGLEIKRHYWPYIAVFMVLLISSACSFPSPEPETPTPSPFQEFEEQPTATFPVEPTPTPQVLPPGLVESDPPPNSEVGLDGPVIFYFNQSMDHGSVERAFSGLSGRFEWLDESTLVFTPDEPLTPTSQINLQFDTQAQAANGLALVEPISLVYHAAGFLNLAQNLPEDGTTEVDPSAAIVATFNRPVVPLGADQSNVPAAFSVEPAAEGRGEWINTSTYAFYPEPPLAGGTEYTVQLSSDLTGLDGSPLENRLSWSFTTTEPNILSIEPGDGSGNVSLDSEIRFTFNQPMDPDSVESEFTMLDAEKNRVRGKFSWNEEATEFVFTPDNLLKRDRVYAIILGKEVSSKGGTQTGMEYQATLETVSELRVIGSDPANNGQKDVYSSVAIEFNSPIKLKDTIKFITISPPVLDLEAFADEEERTIWLSGFYEPDTAYTLTISPNLPDKWNGRLGQEYVLNFRTRSIDPSLTVTTGSEVVFLTPEQSSITVQVTNLPDLTYSLGVVPLEDFQEVLAPGNYEARQAYRPESELTLQHELEIPPNQSTPVEIPLTLDGEPLAPGIYSLRFNVGVNYIYPGPYFLVVSDINTTLKLSATDVLVWAVNLNDGSVVESAPVSVYSESGDLLAQGLTDP
ncbi:MAG: Ig-like domain-containing protein, partial [Chloroflexota bacterium]